MLQNPEIKKIISEMMDGGGNLDKTSGLSDMMKMMSGMMGEMMDRGGKSDSTSGLHDAMQSIM